SGEGRGSVVAMTYNQQTCGAACARLHGGAGRGAVAVVARVGALVRGLLEEVVLQRVVGRDARLGVVLQHAQDQVLELEVVGRRVANLARPAAPGPARVGPYHVVQLPAVRSLVLVTVWQELEVFPRLLRLVQQMFGRHTQHLHNLHHLIHLIGAGEQRLSRVHLYEDAAQAPHTKLFSLPPKQNQTQPIIHPIDHTHPLSDLAGAAEVDDLDGAALGVAQQDVLGLEVAVDDVQLGRGQVEQRGAQLLGKLARQVQGNPAEVGVAQQVVQVVAQQLKHKAQVVAEHEPLTYIILVLPVVGVHQLQQLDLDLRLVQEWFLVLDDLDGHMLLVSVVKRLHDLPHT
ncbi:hypothetical protein EGW08_019651, partial [Elysia chlorotica]